MNDVEYTLPLWYNRNVIFTINERTITGRIVEHTTNTIYIELCNTEHTRSNIDNIFTSICKHTIKEVYKKLGIPVNDDQCWITCTEEQLIKVLEYLKSHCNSKREPLKEPLKENYYGNEIRLQKPKATIKRGTVPTGCRIRCTVRKTSISSKPLEYTAISR